jgi:glycosyltransferase involved in cell wall biosynthesis
MKILVLFNSSYLPPRGIGGAEKRFLEISKRWIKYYGATIYVIEPKSSLISTYKSYKVKLPFTTKYTLFTTIIRTLLWLPSALFLGLLIAKRHKVDLIFLPLNSLSNVLPGLILSRILKIPWIVTYPFPHLAEFSNNFLKMFQNYSSQTGALDAIVQTIASFLSISCIKRASCIITNGPKSLMTQMGIPPEKVSVTINGVDTTFYSFEEKSLNKCYDATYIGRLTPEKGLLDLVKVWKYVTMSRPNSILAIVGSGRKDFVEFLRKIIVKAGLANNIVLLGFLPDVEAKRILISSKVFIYLDQMTAVYPFPSSVLESMSCGIPVVMYNTYKQINQEQNTLVKSGVRLVPIKHIKEVANEVLTLLSNPEFARKIGELGRSFSKNYTWDRVAAVDYKILWRVLKQNN